MTSVSLSPERPRRRMFYGLMGAVMAAAVVVAIKTGDPFPVAFTPFTWLLWSGALPAVSGPEPTLELSSEALTITHPQLGEPLAVNLDRVHSIWSGAAGRPGWWVVDLVGFAQPNLTIVLSPAIDPPPAFRTMPFSFTPFRKNNPVRGIRLKVADPGEAKRALSTWMGPKVVDSLPADVPPWLFEDRRRFIFP